jgi:hypothetical protein
MGSLRGCAIPVEDKHLAEYSSPLRKDEEIVLAVGFGEIVTTAEGKAGLFHFVDDD